MNNIEELKSKKPENLKSRSSVSADYVTDDNTGGYFVVECGNCGEVFPSQKLDGGGAIADSGDYGDAYCPHCNETDPDECANVGLVWNVQQAKINALIAQLEAAQKERDALHGILNIERGGSAFESKRTAYIDGMRDKWRERAEKAEAQLIKAEKGEVLVTVSGFTGCGKSAVAGEIEIALLAIGVPVRWTNGDAEKRMTGADYLTALEMYKPHVRIVERNIAGGKWYE